MTSSRFILLLMFGLLAALQGVAPAAADVFRVNGNAVDETAATAREARDKGYATARMRAAQKLIDRLTLPEDRNAASSPIQVSEIARLGGAIQTGAGGEKSTATRYIATLGVGFPAASVRAYLDSRGVPFVDSQAGRSLIIPMASGALDLVGWTEAWRQAADDTSLTPFRVASGIFPQKPTWQQIAPEVGSTGSFRAVYAELIPLGTGMTVRLTEAKAGQADTVLGTVGPYSDLAQAQASAVRELETIWKRATIVRATGVSSMAIVAGFRDVNDWIRIRRGLESSRMIKELKIDSLSALGADLSLVVAGRPDQLATDLSSKGIILTGSDGGWRLEAAPPQ